MIFPWHKSAYSKLKKMIDQNHLPHALLITGVEKIGKFELAQKLIQTLLCTDSSCGKCVTCLALMKDEPTNDIVCKLLAWIIVMILMIIILIRLFSVKSVPFRKIFDTDE